MTEDYTLGPGRRAHVELVRGEGVDGEIVYEDDGVLTLGVDARMGSFLHIPWTAILYVEYGGQYGAKAEAF